jgi:spore coat-associated protein N
MSRLQVIVNRPRRTLAALATVLVAVGVTAASGADFTATSANPTNTFSAGTLSISNSQENAAFFTATGMRPGNTRTGTVDIGNSGSLSGAFSLTRGTPVNSGGANLSTVLDLVVVDCGAFAGATAPSCDGGDPQVYSGLLSAMSSPIALGTFAGGEKHRYEFRVEMDSSAANEYQGTSSEVTFTWNAA